jgi:ribosomal protein S18 acetylase RimI-like enzyme
MMNTHHQESAAPSSAKGSGITKPPQGVEKIRIRKIRWMDWRKVTRLFREIFPELTDQQISHYILQYEDTIVVAEARTGIIGFYHFIPRDDEGTAWLNYLGVIPSCYRGGVGTQLLRDYEERAASMGFRLAEFDVLQHNQRAIKFYEKHGYARLYPFGDKFRYQKILMAEPRVADDPRPVQTRLHLPRVGRRLLYLALVSLPLLFADIFQ